MQNALKPPIITLPETTPTRDDPNATSIRGGGTNQAKTWAVSCEHRGVFDLMRLQLESVEQKRK